VQGDAGGGSLPVDIVENAAGDREVQEVGAGEGAVDRDAVRRPTVREADSVLGFGSQRSGGHGHFKAIVHRRTDPLVSAADRPPMMPGPATGRPASAPAAERADARSPLEVSQAGL
jgi:hypothetical protein